MQYPSVFIFLHSCKASAIGDKGSVRDITALDWPVVARLLSSELGCLGQALVSVGSCSQHLPVQPGLICQPRVGELRGILGLRRLLATKHAPMTGPRPVLLLRTLLLWGLLPEGWPLNDVDVGRLHLDRRQMEQAPAPLPEPSCAQLRAMWRQMHRMARHSQLTNEIPQFPAAYPFGYVAPDVGNKAVYFYPGVPAETPRAAFGKIVRKPGRGRPRVPASVRPLGRFADAPFPRKALGSYGTLVRSPDEKEQYRQQQEALGSWGRFPGDTAGGTRSSVAVLAEENLDARPSFVVGDGPGSRSYSYDRKQEWCHRTVLNRPCTTHQDCFCSRTKFFCSSGKCRSSAVRKASTDQWGSWYSGPLESSRLGQSGTSSDHLPSPNNV